jgi:hypothetical protein
MKFIKKKISEPCTHKVIFIAIIGISLVLLVAAYGKWFYPAELLKMWDRGISIFELLFIGLLFYARKSFKLWVIAAFIFASWGGYAYFWYQVNLPCSCMGEMLHIPTKFSLLLDAFFFGLSLLFAYLMGGAKRAVYLGVMLGVFGFGLGFLCAKGIYHCFVMANG